MIDSGITDLHQGLQDDGEKEEQAGEDGRPSRPPALTNTSEALGVDNERRYAEHSSSHRSEPVDYVQAIDLMWLNLHLGHGQDGLNSASRVKDKDLMDNKISWGMQCVDGSHPGQALVYVYNS